MRNQSLLNKKKVWTEQSLEHFCSNTMNSSRPASIDLKMTELSLVKCKNVISYIKKKIEDEGDEIAPLLADTFNRNKYSTYKNSWAGLRTLNFKNISQRLDENGYESVHDFVKEVQNMLKGVADEFVFLVEVISEARTIHDLFFEIMARTFENIDFCNAKSEVEFPTSTFNTFLLGKKPSVRHKRKRTTEWAKFTKKDKGSS